MHAVMHCMHLHEDSDAESIISLDFLFGKKVSAEAQNVVCRATMDCAGITDLGVMSAEDCCVNTPNALSFSIGEICSNCIGECTRARKQPAARFSGTKCTMGF